MKKEILRTLIKEAAEEESKLDKAKKWVKENPGKVGAGVGTAVGAGLGLGGAKKLNDWSKSQKQPYFDQLKKMKNTAEDIGDKIGDYDLRDRIQNDMKDMVNKHKKDSLANYGVLGAEGAALGGIGGAFAGDALKNKNKEKNATIEKLAADYVNLKKGKNNEFSLSKFHKPKEVAKKHTPGVAGAGIGGFAANKLTKNKNNKKKNTLLGAAAGGTIGELARRMKKKANAGVALKGSNEAVISSFSPRTEEEPTEKLKRMIRKYENDRG